MDLFQQVLEAHQEKNEGQRQMLLQELNSNINQLKPAMQLKEFIRLFRGHTSFLQIHDQKWQMMERIAEIDKKISDLTEIAKKEPSSYKTYVSLYLDEGDFEGDLNEESESDVTGGTSDAHVVINKIKDKLTEKRVSQKNELLDILVENSPPSDQFMPGPVGAYPIHECFLLGLTDIGKEVLERCNADPRLLNAAYKDDLLPLQGDAKGEVGKSDRSNLICFSRKKALLPLRRVTTSESTKVRPENAGQSSRKGTRLHSICTTDSNGDPLPRESGLYTGETLLHIAIVKEDVGAVKFLLQKGIDTSARATGVFFQPKWIRPHVKDLSWWQRFLSWIVRIDLNVEKFAVMTQEKNVYSACYYGEYPLSFAASIGSVQMCRLLLSEHKKISESKSIEGGTPLKDASRGDHCRTNPSQTFTQDNRHSNVNADCQLGCSLVPKTSLREYLNRGDSFGNTALHMAVLHRKKDVIDCLITTKNADLEVLNNEGFTPLTYAARLGHIDIYNHILFTHLSRTGWTYGKVNLWQTTSFYKTAAMHSYSTVTQADAQNFGCRFS